MIRLARLAALLALTMALGAGNAAAHIAYVANGSGVNSVKRVDVEAGTVGTGIATGSEPAAVAATPDGATVLVANSFDATVTPVNVAAGTGGTAIGDGEVGQSYGIAISPDGKKAYL